MVHRYVFSPPLPFAFIWRESTWKRLQSNITPSQTAASQFKFNFHLFQHFLGNDHLGQLFSIEGWCVSVAAQRDNGAWLDPTVGARDLYCSLWPPWSLCYTVVKRGEEVKALPHTTCCQRLPPLQINPAPTPYPSAFVPLTHYDIQKHTQTHMLVTGHTCL